MPEVDVTLALRYMGVQTPDADMLERATRTAELMQQMYVPRNVWRVFEVAHGEGQVSLPEAGVTLHGRLAGTMLAECDRAAILVCTLGQTFDLGLLKVRAADMAQAVILDACGSAYVETGCDAAEEELRERHPGLYLTDRFSPGYGDLPLDIQPQLLAAVNAQRRLGVTLTDTNLMNPSKSVTAIIGLSDRPQSARIRGCAWCAMRGNCAYRKRGEQCHV